MADIGGSKVGVHSLQYALNPISSSQVSQFSTTVLSAMLAGMDDREDPMELITMEAMNGLSRIFEKIDEGHVRPILINIALRIRPCFEKVCYRSMEQLVYCLFLLSLLLLYVLLPSTCLAVCHDLVMGLQKVPSWNRYRLTLLRSSFT